jgi:hypothetical protein
MRKFFLRKRAKICIKLWRDERDKKRDKKRDCVKSHSLLSSFTRKKRNTHAHKKDEQRFTATATAFARRQKPFDELETAFRNEKSVGDAIG